METTETTVVIFRMDREGVVFALFPELPADNYGYFCTGGLKSQMQSRLEK